MTPFVRDNLRFVLKDKKILLGVTGSIAAYKSCELIRLFRDCGAEVRVVLTESAEKFVTKVTLETLSQNPVLGSLWEQSTQGTHHIDTARWADLALIAPATANTIAKLSHGFADDLLTTELLAFQGPICISPAMNPQMYSNPATQENIERLKTRGVRFLGPASGATACGEEGLGRMVEPDQICEQVAESFHATPKNERLLISLGPTRSPVDPVRYFSNRSSGLMGAALVWAAVQRGHKVTAICGPTTVELPRSAKKISVTTAQEMAQAVLELWPSADVYIGAAAVLDWDIDNPHQEKLKKGTLIPSLKLRENLDILAEVSRRRERNQKVIGFAAETRDIVEYARQKLSAKGCDAVFANDVSQSHQGFESLENSGFWITKNELTPIGTHSKTELARILLGLIDRTQNTPSLRSTNELSH
ncbi:MAG: bifunctional phosphopantothenoylcysteine decarboxylase/phosphopantothenate--cysteine ligase CoaBC [Bdellovibrionota bacterium]